MTADLSGARTRLQERAILIATRAADVCVDLTREATSRRTGALADSIVHTQPALIAEGLVGCVISAGNADVIYARWQDEGTGIYGPTGGRIFPTRAKALRFDWPAAGGIVFAKSVAGAPGRHYFHEPMPARWRSALAEVIA